MTIRSDSYAALLARAENENLSGYIAARQAIAFYVAEGLPIDGGILRMWIAEKAAFRAAYLMGF